MKGFCDPGGDAAAHEGMLWTTKGYCNSQRNAVDHKRDAAAHEGMLPVPGSKLPWLQGEVLWGEKEKDELCQACQFAVCPGSHNDALCGQNKDRRSSNPSKSHCLCQGFQLCCQM